MKRILAISGCAGVMLLAIAWAVYAADSGKPDEGSPGDSEHQSISMIEREAGTESPVGGESADGRDAQESPPCTSGTAPEADEMETIAEAEGGESGQVRLEGRKDGGDYWGMKLTVGDMSRQFPWWYNVGNLSYAPSMQFADLNADGNDELLVVLTKGYGTETLLTEPHLLTGDGTDEILIEDWKQVLLRHVSFGELRAEGAELRIDGTTQNVPTPMTREEFEDNRDHWIKKPGYGSQIRYVLHGGKLTAIASVWISPATPIGEFEIGYAYKQGFMQGDQIKFISYDEDQAGA